MSNLFHNIEILEKIDEKHGLDEFVHSESPRNVINFFLTGEYKLHYMGVSLVCEYLKNVGVSCAKPDVHVMRFLSKTRCGFLSKPETRINNHGEIVDTNWTTQDKLQALEIIEDMSCKFGKSEVDIDRIIWSFCADRQGEICTRTPKCIICPIREGCNYLVNNRS